MLNIKQIRESLGLSQKDAAYKAERMHPSQWTHIETSDNNGDAIGMGNLLKVAKALDCELIVELKPKGKSK